MDIKSCRYYDGNGNEYIINSTPKFTIEYNPVTPLESSSGIYDGGEYVKGEISEQLYNKTILIIGNIIKNREILINDRVKGSGMIIFQDEDKEDSYILKPSSKEIDKIEELLHELIRN